MNIKTIFLVAMASCTMMTHAESWDLDSCINYAIRHNITIKSRNADCISAELDVTEAKNRFLPELSANASQSFNFGRGLTSENIYANRNTSNFQWGAQLSLPLFQGLSAIRQTKYAKANLQAVIQEYEAAKDNVTLNVISAYLQALYCKEIHLVAINQVELSQNELERRNHLLEAGKIPEIDMLEAKSQLAQDELAKTTAQNDYMLALLDLSQLLELENIDGFNIAPLQENDNPILSAEEVYRNAIIGNHSILASRNRINAAERNVELAKSGYIPRLSLNAGLGSSYYKVNGFDNQSFADQMNNNFNTYVGFTLNIPIFDAFSTRNSIKKAQVQHLSAQLQYDSDENSLYKAIQQAYYQAVGAKKKLQASIDAEYSAQQTFEAMKEKYNLGRATPTEYDQAKTKYLKATSERVQAKYESILRNRILQFYNSPQ